MIQIGGIITPQRIDCAAPFVSKKRALERLSDLLVSAQTGLQSSDIFDGLLARERLGSTGVGHGVAIPHGRISTSDDAVGAFVHLESGIDFDAIDDQPVDLLFALLVPEDSTDEHLKLLAQLAKMFADKPLRDALRAAKSNDDIYHLLANAPLPQQIS